MMGKYVALVDWQVARLLANEYLCQNVYDLTQEATDRIFRMADKVTAEQQPDFHGLQVGVATLLISRLYNDVAKHEKAYQVKERTDWGKVYAAYGSMKDDIVKANNPSVMDEIIPSSIEKRWGEIRRYIKQYLNADAIEAALTAAGCPADISGIDISPELCEAAMQYHPYMRHRITFARAMKAMEFA